MKRPTILVDISSLFIRQYAAHPDLDIHGEPIGGTIGSLKVIQKLVSEFSAKEVIVVWESGGSSRRRGIYSEYKQGRRPARLNRFYEDDLPDTEDNRERQIRMLVGALRALPVAQVYVQDCEADDVIAYICKYRLQDDQKIILSTDRDYYQLLDDNTLIYNPHKKTLIGKNDVKKEFFVETDNFALAKALCGDASDNIEGVKGLGYKTLVKKVPIMALNRDVTVDMVIQYARSHEDEGVVMKRIGQSEDLIRRNWSLVYLGTPALSSNQKDSINYVLDNFEPRMSLKKLISWASTNDVSSLNPQEVCTKFTPLLFRKKT